jgi:hypothetical protein
MADRKVMLSKYLENDLLKSLSSLSESELKAVNFSQKTNDPLIEALKKLIFSYCQEDAQVTILRNVNVEIQNNVLRLNR